VAKYDAVLANLEFARELAKHIQQQSKEAEKEQKKQARKVNWLIYYLPLMLIPYNSITGQPGEDDC